MHEMLTSGDSCGGSGSLGLPCLIRRVGTRFGGFGTVLGYLG